MIAIFKIDKEQKHLFKILRFSLKFVLTFLIILVTQNAVLPRQVIWLLGSNSGITVEHFAN